MLPREGCPPGRMRCPGDIGAFPPGPRASSLSMSNSPAKPSRARCLRSLEIEAMLAFLVWAFSFSRSACTCLEYFLASRCFRLRAAESCQRTSDLAASDDYSSTRPTYKRCDYRRGICTLPGLYRQLARSAVITGPSYTGTLKLSLDNGCPFLSCTTHGPT
jgi:hypothetical protein